MMRQNLRGLSEEEDLGVGLFPPLPTRPMRMNQSRSPSRKTSYCSYSESGIYSSIRYTKPNQPLACMDQDMVNQLTQADVFFWHLVIRLAVDVHHQQALKVLALQLIQFLVVNLLVHARFR